jgi:hypothetical protein
LHSTVGVGRCLIRVIQWGVVTVALPDGKRSNNSGSLTFRFVRVR